MGIGVHGQHEHASRDVTVPDLLKNVEAVLAGESEREDDEVPGSLGQPDFGFLGGLGLANDKLAVLLAEHSPQAIASQSGSGIPDLPSDVRRAQGDDSGARDVREKPEGAVGSLLACAKCRRPCRRLTKAAYCRGCSADIELARQIREVRAEHPGVSAEELAYKIKDRAELKRLTARVRRVLREAVA
jgi:hypothetical protein